MVFHFFLFGFDFDCGLYDPTHFFKGKVQWVYMKCVGLGCSKTEAFSSLRKKTRVAIFNI